MKRSFTIMSAMLLFGGLSAACLADNSLSADPVNTLIGKQAGEIQLLDTQGAQINLRNYCGQTVVLNFWAFWCDTWKAELPHLKELVKQEGDSHFKLVAISVDGTRYSEFIKYTTGTLPFPVCMDINSNVTHEYKVTKVPTVVVIDPSGIIRYIHSGYPGNGVVLSQVRNANAAVHHAQARNDAAK